MSHAEPGPLASYNSLQDPHLGGFFSNTRMKKHLEKSGLVTKSGKVVSEKTYRLKMAKKEHKDHVRDLLATAIVHKALDMERSRQHELRKRLDDMYKVELVRKVKSDREKKGDEDVMSLLTTREKVRKRRRPRTAPTGHVLAPSELGYDEERGRLYYNVAPSDTSTGDEMNSLISGNGYNPYYKPYPPATYPMPAPPPTRSPREGSRSRSAPSSHKKSKLKLHRYTYLAHSEPAIAHKVQLQSMAEVTMRFLGPKLQLKNDMFPDERLCEVMVLQQHCGGSSLCVFRELLPPNTIFTFISRRHRGTPFGLTFYIDSMQDIRLSSCCEYKHKPGHILGGKNGHFQFVNVEGAAPCYRCQIAFSMKERKSQSGKSKVKDRKEKESDDGMAGTSHETAEQHHPGDDDEGNDVTERFEVTITRKMESEDDDSAVMVDTTTQTPRDDSVTENHDPKSTGDHEGTTGDTEKQKEEAEAGESTKDSGIHQDEDGYDESYADEEFEEDDAQSVVDKESPREENREGNETDEVVEIPPDVDDDKVDDEDEEIEDETEEGTKNVIAVAASEADQPEEVHSEDDSGDEKEKKKDSDSDSSSSSSDSEDNDSEDEKPASKVAEKVDSDVESKHSKTSDQDSEKSDSRRSSIKDETDHTSDNESVSYGTTSETDLGNNSVENSATVSKNEPETIKEEIETSSNAKNGSDGSISPKSVESVKESVKDENSDNAESDRHSEKSVESEKDSDSEKEDEDVDSDRKVSESEKDTDKDDDKDSDNDHESEPGRKGSGTVRNLSDSENQAEKNDDTGIDQKKSRSEEDQISDKKDKKGPVSENESDSEKGKESGSEKGKESGSEKDKESSSEKDTDKDSDSDSDSDSDKDSSSDSDDDSSKKSSGKESRSGSDAESEKSSKGSRRSSKDSADDSKGSRRSSKDSGAESKPRPDSAGSGILRDPSKTPDLSDDESRPKKTVSFNEEVKVYVGVGETGDEEDIEGDAVHDATTGDDDGELEESPETETVDKESDLATQGDNEGEQGSLENTEVHKEPQENEKKDTTVEPGKNVEEVEIQQASPPSGISESSEDTEGSLGKDVDLETGEDENERNNEGDSGLTAENTEKIGDENKEQEKSGSGSDRDEVDAGSKEAAGDEDGNTAQSSQEKSIVSLEPSDSESSSKQGESDKELTDTDQDLDPGNDPDSVGSGEPIPERALKAVGTKPGVKHEGSVKTLIEDQKDLEIASVALNPEQVEEVASMVENNSEVGSLTLRNVSLGDDGVKQLTNVLKTSANVKMLNLNVNNIGPDGAVHVAETIRHNTAMKMLLLHGNPLGDQGVTSIVDAILGNEASALSTLDVGDCGLGDLGATQIARLLEKNNTISDLNISANQITVDGWREISKALKVNTKLRALSLDYNKISDDDLAVLSDGFRHSVSLRSVDLEANRIRDEGGRLLLDVLRENEKIIDLTLMPMNTIDEGILEEIKDLLDNRIRSRPSSANSEDTSS